MTLKKVIPLLIAILIFVPACNKKEEERVKLGKIQFDWLKLKTIRLSDKAKTEGFVIGATIERNEVYIQKVLSKHDFFSIVIMDSLTGAIKREIQLSRGTHQSPTDYYNPSFMQFSGKRFYIIDQYSKILVYDDQMNYLSTHMFQMFRYFIDFYERDTRTFFVIGAQSLGMEFYDNRIQIFHLPDNSRPVLKKEIGGFRNPAFGKKNRQDRSKRLIGPLWPSGRGFEKDGNIYFSNNNKTAIISYNLKSKKYKAYSLKYLKPKTYSEETVNKFAFSHSNGWEKKMKKKHGRTVIAVPYDKPLYHFGLYDVGKNKIGIVGDIDTIKYEFRLDVIDIHNWKYMESYRFPFGAYFRRDLGDGADGRAPTYIDVDKGVYVWTNEEGEDFIPYARIDSFKVLPDKGAAE